VAAFARCEQALSAAAWSYRSAQTEDTMSSQTSTLFRRIIERVQSIEPVEAAEL
jgi:hypothetical protein